MAKRKPAPYVKPPIAGPGNFHAEAAELGLATVTYLRLAANCDDGASRWIPEDLIGSDGQTLIRHRLAGHGNYDIDGWEPWHAGMFGGRYERFESALAWVRVARDVRAGRRDDFRGV
jgi:hypothetical protein